MRYFAYTILCLIIASLLNSCYRILPSKGGGQISKAPQRHINSEDILVPDGYKVIAVANGLTFPTAIAFDDSNTPYVIESGYSYGEEFLNPRLLRIEGDGSLQEVFKGEVNGPWNGISYLDGHFYIAEGGELHGGKILRINSSTWEVEELIKELPGMGDHHTNGLALYNGYIYFGQGTATNSGVVGNDNADFGWLRRYNTFHDIPCEDIVVNAQNFPTPNILTDDKMDIAVTGPFSPYNKKVTQGQTIKGQVPCSGSVMRLPQDGGEPELVAWGFRNPYGISFSPDGRLFVSDNSYDERGSRPVWGTGDVLWQVEQGKWYGWPDFNGGIPLVKLKVPGEDDPKPLLAEYPGEVPRPVAKLGVHSSSNGMDFSTNVDFGFNGDLFIAQFGDMAPGAGKVLSPVGFKVVRVEVNTGIVEDFMINKGKKDGPASWQKSGGLERPVSVTFNPEGDALYIVDFGILTTDEGIVPLQKTGVVWKVVKE